MSIAERNANRRHGREIEGITACLLPFEEDGSIAKEAFQESVRRTEAAGLKCAVNMDTGYANYLTEDERNQVLDWTREALGSDKPFVAGVFVEGLEGDLIDLYHRGGDQIAARGGTPILFQTTRFHDWAADKIVDLYAKVCAPYEAVLGFELGKIFAPNGMIYSEEIVSGLMRIPSLKGMKHSSLSRDEELKRLALRDEIRPDFRIYTGNDLGIDMIEYGSDYLLGLAAFCPEKFAERDRLWREGDEAYYELNDALQYLGNVAFRPAVPAYKHSCAVFQHLLSRIPSSEPHPRCPRRPEWEAGILSDCAKRLGYEI
ncbi:dihydrodipicolinate synthase family protein [Akkermansiaceae bacterium]|jgi:dihydrodipicolinate synthase/N-acetylneuraminate lyase|nr:dihydrodipicolinate synthase family protein [Akkermansiaceae bacterium]MDB4519762.1 dihydrodipicolinate synthase family protein [Akkermansiaceae bacterium]|tara:strand:- start:12553 stop:13500 length:948 start_codon:yes stop_codon:yes gene_type:complete